MPDTIKEELQAGIVKHKRFGRGDFLFSEALFWTAIAASAAVTLGFVHTWLAAIPGVVMLIDKTFSFPLRSKWHWIFQQRLMALYRRMRDEGLDDKTASQELSKLEAEMEDKYPATSGAFLPTQGQKQGE